MACKLNTAFITFGVLTNIVCVYIFFQKQLLKHKFNWYLLALSIFELIFCFILSIDYIFNEVSTQSIFLHDLNTFTKITFNFLIHTTDSYTVVLTLLLSIDRYKAYSKPLKIKYLITNLHAKSLIIVSFAVLLLLKIPSFSFCEYKSSSSSSASVIRYCTLVSPLIFNIIPMLAVFVLNLFLIIKIFQYNNNSDFIRKFNTKTNSKRSLVILITALWAVFTSTPYYILTTYSVQHKFNLFLFQIDLKSARVAQIISSILFNSNHFINFFIYLGFHREFKNCFKERFFFKKTLKNKNFNLIVARRLSQREMQTFL